MNKSPHIYFITDPLVTTAGSVRPSLLLTKKFSELGYDVTIVTTKTNKKLNNYMKTRGYELVTIGPESSYISSMPNLDAWLRHILVNNKCIKLTNPSFIVNTSSTSIHSADVYYAQGIMMKAVKDMISSLPLHYKLGYNVSKTVLNYLERKTNKKYEQVSKYFIANSRFCSKMYEGWGIHVDDVINPPLNTDFFKPSTNNPKENYILTFFGTLGKESNYKLIRQIADKGINIKVFGELPVDKTLLNQTQIDFLGRVSDTELVDLYSNALLTLFAFKHEPFGYIPVESMACGTPVLSYNKQGPSETIRDKDTGWLTDSDPEMLRLVDKIWNQGIKQSMRYNCVKSMQKYSIENITEKWKSYLDDQK